MPRTWLRTVSTLRCNSALASCPPPGAKRASVTRVLIVDDHAVVRSGLRLVLDAEEGIEAVGEAGTARDAVFEAR